MALAPYFPGPYLNFALSFPNHVSCPWPLARSGEYDGWDVSGIEAVSGIKEMEIGRGPILRSNKVGGKQHNSSAVVKVWQAGLFQDTLARG